MPRPPVTLHDAPEGVYLVFTRKIVLPCQHPCSFNTLFLFRSDGMPSVKHQVFEGCFRILTKRMPDAVAKMSKRHANVVMYGPDNEVPVAEVHISACLRAPSFAMTYEGESDVPDRRLAQEHLVYGRVGW
jgi:hypothetical protein